MTHVRANGVSLHVQRLDGRHPAAPGAPPTVVFLHGLVMDNLSSFWYTLANPVARHADVILYDLRGHGRSEMPPAGYTVDDAVADLLGLLDALDVDHPVHLVGNSYGGVVALGCAIAHPDRVAGLTLIEAHFAVEGWGDHMAGSLALAAFGLDEPELQAWLSDQGGRKLNRMARAADRLINDTSLIDDLQAVRPITEEELKGIGCPTLALYGEHSDLLDRAHDLDRLVPGCDLHILPDRTHSLLMEDTATLRRLVMHQLGVVDGGSDDGDDDRRPGGGTDDGDDG